jgi:hypothetical protein
MSSQNNGVLATIKTVYKNNFPVKFNIRKSGTPK